MNNTKCLPEPWAARPIKNDRLNRFMVVCLNDDRCPGTGKEVVATGIRTESTARRIVACVNACAGISTENLEDNKPIIELARAYNDALRQRDQLLAALQYEELIYSKENHAITPQEKLRIVELRRAAIASAEQPAQRNALRDDVYVAGGAA